MNRLAPSITLLLVGCCSQTPPAEPATCTPSTVTINDGRLVDSSGVVEVIEVNDPTTLTYPGPLVIVWPDGRETAIATGQLRRVRAGDAAEYEAPFDIHYADGREVMIVSGRLRWER